MPVDDVVLRQVVLIASGYDTRAWRLRWPQETCVYEVDSAMIQSQVRNAGAWNALQRSVHTVLLQPMDAARLAPASQQKMIALGDIQPNCNRLALIGDVFNLPAVFKSLASVGFKASKPVRGGSSLCLTRRGGGQPGSLAACLLLLNLCQ